MTRRGGLGKGLGALIPQGEGDEVEGASLRELPVTAIHPNQYQPRTVFEDEALEQLTASVEAIGVLQPVLVRPVGDRFELIAGERRWRAAQAAGLATIPAIVRETDDTTSLEQALVENLHRQDLTAIEEAAAYQQLVDDFAMTYEQVGQRVGKSKSAVANTIRLLQLPAHLQRQVNDRELSAGHARALLAVDDPAVQETLADTCVREGWSVRALEEAVRRAQRVAPAEKDPGKVLEASRKPASLLELERLLGDLLDTRVQVMMGGRQRGRIVIEFAGLEDLERLYRVITEGREPST